LKSITRLISIPTADLALQLTVAPVIGADGRGVRVQVKASDTPDAKIVEEVELNSRPFALVIGINEYSNEWPRLSNAVSDARKIASALEADGFEMTLNLNLGSSNLKDAFGVYKTPGQSAQFLDHNGLPINIGNDWGLQSGSRKSPVRTLSDVSQWTRDGKGAYFHVTSAR
jgi:hypothetical protein